MAITNSDFSSDYCELMSQLVEASCMAAGPGHRVANSRRFHARRRPPPADVPALREGVPDRLPGARLAHSAPSTACAASRAMPCSRGRIGAPRLRRPAAASARSDLAWLPVRSAQLGSSVRYPLYACSSHMRPSRTACLNPLLCFHHMIRWKSGTLEASLVTSQGPNIVWCRNVVLLYT